MTTVSKLAAVMALLLAALPARAAGLPEHPERLGDREFVERYIAVVEDEGQTAIVRNYAAAQIMKRGEKALPHVMALYDRADAKRRGVLADVMAGITTRDEKVRKLLLDDLERTGSSTDPRVVRALGLMEAEDAVEDLLRILPSTTGDLRLSVLCALGRIGDERAADALVEGLDSEDRMVRTHCTAGVVKVLIKLKPEKNAHKIDPAYQPLMTRALDTVRTGRRQDVRRMLILGLGRVGDEQAAPVVRRLLSREADPIRAAAAEASGLLKDRRAVDDLVEMIREDNAFIRRSALRALGDIGDRACTPALIRLLETCEPSWRREVVLTLRKVTAEPFGDNPAQWRHWWESR